MPEPRTDAGATGWQELWRRTGRADPVAAVAGFALAVPLLVAVWAGHPAVGGLDGAFGRAGGAAGARHGGHGRARPDPADPHRLPDRCRDLRLIGPHIWLLVAGITLATAAGALTPRIGTVAPLAVLMVGITGTAGASPAVPGLAQFAGAQPTPEATRTKGVIRVVGNTIGGVAALGGALALAATRWLWPSHPRDPTGR